MNTRYHFLDVLRGFAIAGILLVNTADITRLGYDVPFGSGASAGPAEPWLHYLVSGRFVPIFELLFGVSLALVIASVRNRGAQPAWVLVRRFGALFVIGLAHALVYPGEILRIYAVAGLVCLPVVLLVPRAIVLGLGVVGTAVGFGVFGGGIPATPGLFLLGAAAVAYGLLDRLEHPTRGIRIAVAVVALAAVPALWWQSQHPGDPRFTTAGGVAGGVLALLYIGLLALLTASPVGRVLRAAFEPLGRMALTNYVTASLIVAPLGLWLGFTRTRDLAPGLVIAVAVLLVQSLVSRLWLHHFRYGPIEWLWRMVTWLRPVPLRRSSPAVHGGVAQHAPAIGETQACACGTDGGDGSVGRRSLSR